MNTITPQMTPPLASPVKKKFPWYAILSALGYFVLYNAIRMVIELGYYIYLYATIPTGGLSEEAILELFNQALFRDGNYLMIIMDVLIFLVLAIIFLARGKTFGEGMGMKKTKFADILLAFVAGLGLTCVLSFVMIFVSILFPKVMEDYNSTMDATYNMNTLIPYILAGVIGAPLIEEVVFRHLLAGRLARGIPRVLAIIISSVVFGLVHSHPVQWVYAAVLGFVMACVYFAYDSIWVNIALHAGFNALSVVAYVEALGLNETQLMLVNGALVLIELALALFGTIALVFLLIRRPHKIFEKPVPAVQTAPTTGTVQPVQSIYKPYSVPVGAPVPTVAELSAKSPVAAEPIGSAEPTLPVEPILPVEPVSVEVSTADESGGQS